MREVGPGEVAGMGCRPRASAFCQPKVALRRNNRKLRDCHARAGELAPVLRLTRRGQPLAPGYRRQGVDYRSEAVDHAKAGGVLGRLPLRAVRFETTTDPSQAIACNCSICAKHGLWLTFVSPQQFKLLSGLDDLADHQFNKHVIHHVFCRTCGVELFARGKTKDGKDMFAINVAASTASTSPSSNRSRSTAATLITPLTPHDG